MDWTTPVTASRNMKTEFTHDGFRSLLEAFLTRGYRACGFEEADPGDRHLIPRVIDRAKQGKLMRVGDGSNKVSVVYVENAAMAQLSADDALNTETPVCGGKAYFIAQAEPVHLWEFIGQVLDGVGVARPKRSITYAKARRIGALLEAIHRGFFLPGEPRMTRFVAAQLGTSHWYSIEQAQKEIGYDPKVSTEEGLKRLIEDLKS